MERKASALGLWLEIISGGNRETGLVHPVKGGMILEAAGAAGISRRRAVPGCVGRGRGCGVQKAPRRESQHKELTDKSKDPILSEPPQ